VTGHGQLDERGRAKGEGRRTKDEERGTRIWDVNAVQRGGGGCGCGEVVGWERQGDGCGGGP
jgi:hypothetical protein